MKLWVDPSHGFDHDDPDNGLVKEWIEGVDHHTLVTHDVLDIIWLVQSKNEVQPVIWPMRLRHRHGQDCGRA